MTESYVERNRETWSELSQEFAKTAEREWAGDPVWGIFLIPEADVQFFPGDVAGLDTIELGCGSSATRGTTSRDPSAARVAAISPTLSGVPSPL